MRRVEYDPGWGWIARDKAGNPIPDPDFRWVSRSVARDVVRDNNRFGDLAALRAEAAARV